MIDYADRIFIAGVTGSGKSTVARALFESAGGRRLVIDPADSQLTELDGAVTVADVPPDDAQLVRFVPRHPLEPASYEAIYGWAFDHYPAFVWCDEAGLALPANGTCRAAARLIVQGRKRQIGHLACHTRPRMVLRDLIAQAQHVLVFDLPNPDDRRHIAEIIGMVPAELDGLLAGLPPFGFVWWQQRTRQVTVCPPITPGVNARVLTTP